MATLLTVIILLAVVALAAAVFLLVRAAAGRRTVAPGIGRPAARQRVLPEVRNPAPPAAAAPVAPPAVAVPPATVPAVPTTPNVAAPPATAAVPVRRPVPLGAPPSLVGPDAATSDRADAQAAYATLAGAVELGFSSDPHRFGIRPGSPMERAFAFYAEELLADLRASRQS